MCQINKYDNFIPEPRAQKHNLVQWLINEKWLNLKDLALYTQAWYVIALDWMSLDNLYNANSSYLIRMHALPYKAK